MASVVIFSLLVNTADTIWAPCIFNIEDLAGSVGSVGRHAAFRRKGQTRSSTTARTFNIHNRLTS